MIRTRTDRWLATRIERWFSGAARPLPWRRRRSGWRALVAEIMLQQTQVIRVSQRFEPFMRLFPTPADLAGSTEHAVLVAWQGMGYYRRARLLRDAAIAIVDQHGGRVPRTAEALRELPGVGRYTAGAIASIVFGAREPIVDGNVARVILRVRGIELPLRDRAANERCWREAESLVNAARDPAALNEGLMELGATICTPMRPRCSACPIRPACRAYAEGLVDRIPAPPLGKAPRRVTVTTLVVHDTRRDRVLLVKRPDDGMWSAMWETPEMDASPSSRTQWCVDAHISSPRSAGSFRHLTTHRDFHIRVLVAQAQSESAVARVTEAVARVSETPTRWVSRTRLKSVPISNATLRVIALALGDAKPKRTRAD